MTTHVFKASTVLHADCAAVFAFHENPKNISKISPPSLRLKNVTCGEKAAAGEIFRIEASQFGLPIRWTGMWEKVEEPRLLLDVAISSPFKIWRHSHIFEDHPDGCLMTDQVEYLLKGGWLGALASGLVMPLIFTAMFHARHKATRDWFNCSAPAKAPRED